MKKIVKGNDFTLRIPVMKIVDGEKEAFPLPACTDLAVRIVNAYRRINLSYTIDASADNVLLARVEGDNIAVGTYALEVKGKIFGNDWRSNEYEQFQIVDNNASADTSFDGELIEGEDSVEMNTAVAILPPSVELGQLITDANTALKEVKETDATIANNENLRIEAEKSRTSAEAERAKAEEARATAESEREKQEHAIEKAEAERVTGEKERNAAEAQRVQGETSRVAAETQRVSAEAKRQTESAKAVAAANEAVGKIAITNASVEKQEAERIEAESARAKAEDNRSREEGIRQESETERIRQETARQTEEQARVKAEGSRAQAEEQRNTTLAKTKADCEAATKAANTAAQDATLAKTKADAAATEAEKVDAALNGNVLTVTNRKGEKKSVNLTDTDEHVTVNCTTTMTGVSMEGLTINVYINNGADPHQYTTDANGQTEFTVEKGATYRVVFPYVEKCAIIDPVQHVASVGNRIIDANYIAEVDKFERLTIRMSKADEDGNITPWEGGKAYVIISGKKTKYTMDAEGKAVMEIKNGTSYTVSVDKIDGMYEQYDRYTTTRTAIADSYRLSFIYRPYESGIWLIDDDNKQWTYEDWEASGNDNSKLMFVRIATLATQRYQGDIIISIDKMADFTRVAVKKQWCSKNVEFEKIPLNGYSNSSSDWSLFAYNGLLATQTIIAEGDERELSTPAADYCYGFTIQNGDKTYQGYLPTVNQWVVAWQNLDVVIEAITMKYPGYNASKSIFSGNKWTSTQSKATDSYCFGSIVSSLSKTISYVAFPFYACFSNSPSLSSLSNEGGVSGSGIEQ